jgi:ribonuclease HI
MWLGSPTLFKLFTCIFSEVWSGLGTNNREELLSLWILLKTAVEQKVKRLQILGDSKVVLDWVSGRSRFHNFPLRPVMDIIQRLKGEMEELTYIHIYREFNHREDNLSKEAITVQEGVLIEK